MFIFVGDALGLDVHFKDIWFEFWFGGEAYDGACGEVEVLVNPFYELLNFMDLWLEVFNVILLQHILECAIQCW